MTNSPASSSLRWAMAPLRDMFLKYGWCILRLTYCTQLAHTESHDATRA